MICVVFWRYCWTALEGILRYVGEVLGRHVAVFWEALRGNVTHTFLYKTYNYLSAHSLIFLILLTGDGTPRSMNTPLSQFSDFLT